MLANSGKQQRTAEETVDRARDHARTYHLHRLATALDTQGLHATVKTSYPAALHIFAPGAAMLVFTVACSPWVSRAVASRCKW